MHDTTSSEEQAVAAASVSPAVDGAQDEADRASTPEELWLTAKEQEAWRTFLYATTLLTDRFGDDVNAAGTVHAKTGTLSTVTSLAGGVLDADGRYLVFSVQIDGVDKDKILEARRTVDDVVSALADCGCR